MDQKNRNFFTNTYFKENIHFESIDSTHVYAKKNLERLNDGLFITADYQTSGKGRGSRAWVSEPRQSLLSTLLIKKSIKPENAGLLTLVLALSISQILEEFKIRPKIKWPNDVVVNDKKIAGILAEATVENSLTTSLILSSGINLNQSLEDMKQIDRPATSLFVEIFEKVDVERLRENYIKKVAENLDIFFKKGFGALSKEVRVRAALIGKKISLNIADKSICCKVLDYSDDGSIKVENDDGSVNSFFAGEVDRVY